MGGEAKLEDGGLIRGFTVNQIHFSRLYSRIHSITAVKENENGV